MKSPAKITRSLKYCLLGATTFLATLFVISVLLKPVVTSSEQEKDVMDMVVGGLGPAKGPNEEVQGVVHNIKSQVEEKTGKKYKSLKVLEFKTQVVAGTNYFVKVVATEDNGKESTILLRIYQNLRRQLQLSALKADQPKHVALAYFD